MSGRGATWDRPDPARVDHQHARRVGQVEQRGRGWIEPGQRRVCGHGACLGKGALIAPEPESQVLIAGMAQVEALREAPACSGRGDSGEDAAPRGTNRTRYGQNARCGHEAASAHQHARLLL